MGDLHAAARSLSFDCDEALEAIRRFMASVDDPADREPLRAHVSACAACREHYREVVLTAAQLARASKRSHEALEEEAGAAPPRMSFISPRKSRAPSKLAKLTLGLMVIGVWLAWDGAASASAHVTCEALEGDVRCGADPIAVGAEPSALERRQALSTGKSSRARVRSGGSSIVLGPETAVVVDGTRDLQIHLLEGDLEIDGQATIVTAAGVVEIAEAAGVVELHGAELVVRSRRGTIRVTDASGERLVPPHGEALLRASGARRGDLAAE